MVPPIYTYSIKTKVRGTDIKSLKSHTFSTRLLRHARRRRGQFTSCEKPWSNRYDARGTVMAILRRVRNIGQVVTTCEEPSGQVYVVRETLVKSLRHTRNL